MSSPRRKPSERLLKALAPYQQVLVVTHDNPDPDAVATGWAVWLLVKERLGTKVRLIGGGEIVRAENRHMVRLLEPPIELIGPIDLPAGAAVVLVDCQSLSQTHVFRGQEVPLVAVIDHHEPRGRRGRLAFRDIRPGVASSATIAACYLREQKLEPGPRLATALLLAMHTETRGSETRYCRLDRSMLLWLTGRADPSQLAEIESAPLSRQYYGDLILALQNTFIYGDTAFCLLPRASGPEIVGEVADLLIRGDDIWRVLCGAVVQEDLLVSVRTERDQEDAADLVRRTLAGLGQAGGHRRRAGGRVPGVGPRISEDLQDRLRDRWLEACGVDRQRGTRLVPRRQIVENL
ncbi:MAG: DHH family phosphoesterase [Thermoguttaceae bacterium]